MTSNVGAGNDGGEQFPRFCHLPGELQCHVLSFLPARLLVRDVARTSRHFQSIVDAYVQRRINAALSVTQSDSKRAGCGRYADEPCTLMFEAQRPIDTLTSRHRLYYSHMEYACSGGGGGESDDEGEQDEVSTLQAHFAFVQTSDVDMNASITSNESVQPNAHDAYDGPSSYVQGRRGRRRTNTRTGARPWATWSEPVTSSLAAIERGRRATAGTGARSTSRETGSRDASLARREAHYGESVAAAGARRPPTYRFQLEALDSFETWILSLTVQRLWWQNLVGTAPASSKTAAAAFVRPMRWEKRVVEGLDRIFRDWFKPTVSATIDSQPFVTSPQSPSWIAAMPDERELELDGQGCILRIQPHLNEHAETHPALVSMSSHYYLSTSPYAAAAAAASASAAPPTYVDFTFHCTGLRLNAGRLLSVIEEMDQQVDRTRRQMAVSSGSMAAAQAASGGASSQRSASSDLDGLASSSFIVMSGRGTSGVNWSQTR